MILGLCKPRKRFQILGTEYAGVVEETGAHFDLFKPGDRVAGFRGFGTGCYSEYKCLSNRDSVVQIPDSVDFHTAASVVDGATTALYFLKKAGIQPGQKVLIVGASGSVGSFAVQLVRHFRAIPYGVCSEKNHALAESLGAEGCYDHSTDTIPHDFFDVIFDAAGKSSFAKSKRHLKFPGLYLTTQMSLTSIFQHTICGLVSQKKAKTGLSLKKHQELKELFTLLEQGKLKSHIDRVFPLDQAAKAHQYVENGQKRGNVVISIEHGV